MREVHFPVKIERSVLARLLPRGAGPGFHCIAHRGLTDPSRLGGPAFLPEDQARKAKLLVAAGRRMAEPAEATQPVSGFLLMSLRKQNK